MIPGIGTSPSVRLEHALRQMGDLHMRRIELEQQIAVMERNIFQLRAEVQLLQAHGVKEDKP